MKSSKRRLIQNICIFLIIVSVIVSSVPCVFAENSQARASQYLSSYSCSLWENSSGGLSVQFEVTATGKMTSLGVSTITIQKKVGSSWETVKTYNSTTYSSLLASNTAYHTATISYGSVNDGSTYRAKLSFYARNSSGSDSKLLTSYTVTIT